MITFPARQDAQNAEIQGVQFLQKCSSLFPLCNSIRQCNRKNTESTSFVFSMALMRGDTKIQTQLERGLVKVIRRRGDFVLRRSYSTQATTSSKKTLSQGHRTRLEKTTFSWKGNHSVQEVLQLLEQRTHIVECQPLPYTWNIFLSWGDKTETGHDPIWVKTRCLWYASFGVGD